jgi:hypothetical protein
MLLASPVLADQPVRPSVTAVSLAQPVSLQVGARMGVDTKKKSDLAPAATGAILAGLVAVGVGVGIATSNNHTSP